MTAFILLILTARFFYNYFDKHLFTVCGGHWHLFKEINNLNNFKIRI